MGKCISCGSSPTMTCWISFANHSVGCWKYGVLKYCSGMKLASLMLYQVVGGGGGIVVYCTSGGGGGGRDRCRLGDGSRKTGPGRFVLLMAALVLDGCGCGVVFSCEGCCCGWHCGCCSV